MVYDSAPRHIYVLSSVHLMRQALLPLSLRCVSTLPVRCVVRSYASAVFSREDMPNFAEQMPMMCPRNDPVMLQTSHDDSGVYSHFLGKREDGTSGKIWSCATAETGESCLRNEPFAGSGISDAFCIPIIRWGLGILSNQGGIHIEIVLVSPAMMCASSCMSVNQKPSNRS